MQLEGVGIMQLLGSLPSHRFGAWRLSGSSLAHRPLRCDDGDAHGPLWRPDHRQHPGEVQVQRAASRSRRAWQALHTAHRPVRGAEADCTQRWSTCSRDGRGLALLNCACSRKDSCLVCVSELCKYEHVSYPYTLGSPSRPLPCSASRARRGPIISDNTTHKRTESAGAPARSDLWGPQLDWAANLPRREEIGSAASSLAVRLFPQHVWWSERAGEQRGGRQRPLGMKDGIPSSCRLLFGVGPPASLLTCSPTPPNVLRKQACS